MRSIKLLTPGLVGLLALGVIAGTVAAQEEDSCFSACTTECVNNPAGNTKVGLQKRCSDICAAGCFTQISDIQLPELNQFRNITERFGIVDGLTGRTTPTGAITCGPGACICTGIADCLWLVAECQDDDTYRTVLKCEGIPPNNCTCVYIYK